MYINSEKKTLFQKHFKWYKTHDDDINEEDDDDEDNQVNFSLIFTL